jgi:hypothetical protein
MLCSFGEIDKSHPPSDGDGGGGEYILLKKNNIRNLFLNHAVKAIERA